MTLQALRNPAPQRRRIIVSAIEHPATLETAHALERFCSGQRDDKPGPTDRFPGGHEQPEKRDSRKNHGRDVPVQREEADTSVRLAPPPNEGYDLQAVSTQTKEGATCSLRSGSGSAS